jgi:hypothetical protein
MPLHLVILYFVFLDIPLYLSILDRSLYVLFRMLLYLIFWIFHYINYSICMPLYLNILATLLHFSVLDNPIYWFFC